LEKEAGTAEKVLNWLTSKL